MKKLLFSAVSLDIGGIENALVNLLNYLARTDKYEITLFLEKKEGIFLDKIDKKIQICVYCPNDSKAIILRKGINFIKQTMFRMKYKNKYDFSCAYATYSKPASFVARTASKNSCLWVHSEYMQMFDNNKSKYVEFFEGVKAKEFKNIVFVSENARDIFVENLKNDKDFMNKTSVIYNFIDAEEILRKSQEKVTDCCKEKTFTFLNVGRHTEEDKKLTRLIEAAKKLKENNLDKTLKGFQEDNLDFRILLVGSGNKTQEYKKMVNEYKLENNIIFLGKKQNPYPYFKLADSLILTSEYEGFPVVYLEAMILNIPIITTNVSDSLRIIQNKHGVVTQKNVNSIYNAMKNAIINGISQKEEFDYKEYNQEINEKLEKLIND